MPIRINEDKFPQKKKKELMKITRKSGTEWTESFDRSKKKKKKRQ